MARDIRLTEFHTRLLRKLRKECGIPADSASKLIGMSAGWVGHLERGRYQNVDKAKLEKLLRLLYGERQTFDCVKLFLDDAARMEAEAQSDAEKPWFCREPLSEGFSDFSATAYAGLNMSDTFDKEISLFSAEMKRRFSEATTDTERFVLLRMVTTLQNNLLHTPEATVVLNSTPLFLRTQSESEMMRSAFGFFQKYTRHLRRDMYGTPNPDDVLDQTKAILKRIRAANLKCTAIQNAAFNGEPVKETLATDFNDQIRAINRLCSNTFAVFSALPLADLDEMTDNRRVRKLILRYINELEALEDRVSAVYEAAKAEVDRLIVSRLMDEQSPEYHDAQYQGMLFDDD